MLGVIRGNVLNFVLH